MLSSLMKLSHYGFNQRALTLEDFYSICESEKITVLVENIVTSFYMSVDGQKFIVLSERMSELKTLFIAYHELYHALFGEDERTHAQFFDLQDSAEERAADAFAAVALIPSREIEHVKAVRIRCCCGFGKFIHDERIRVFQTYGI